MDLGLNYNWPGHRCSYQRSKWGSATIQEKYNRQSQFDFKKGKAKISYTREILSLHAQKSQLK